ncbi:MAG: galactokinase [Candidatus Marinimicrobia bacterium]|nr:galactokinase [Candidatus Neomarinimicrobiota bacterium]
MGKACGFKYKRGYRLDRITKNQLISLSKNDFKKEFGISCEYISLAPGRINIIGEHTDYNLGLAMPIAIDRWICVLISKREDSNFNICLSNFNKKSNIDLNSLVLDGKFNDYVIACLKIVKDNFKINKGLNILIKGNIPIGFGVSSSAALEVSLLAGLLKAYDIKHDLSLIIMLSNSVENNYLGINSGILDQYASLYSKKNEPLLIDFSNSTHVYVENNISNSEWVLINSMVNRELVNSKYNERVKECSKGLILINKKSHSKKNMNELTVEDLDLIKDKKILFNRLKHVILENKRVKLMKNEIKKGNLVEIGRLLNESHSSLTNLYQVSCDEIESIINFSSACSGFYGGRIMGGGFGGCTLSLVSKECLDVFIKDVISLFYDKYQYSPEVEVVKFSDGLELK